LRRLLYNDSIADGRVKGHAVTSIVQTKIDDIRALCVKHDVRRLAVFGSATDSCFDPSSSDVDLLVEFNSLSPSQHADSYFGSWMT
jgi:predicted nucleotidyltransferase